MSSVKENPMKRKLFEAPEHDDKSDSHATTAEKKRRRKNAVKTPKHYPKSERQQLAMVLQMTSVESSSPEPTSPPPASSRKTPSGSGRKDKIHKRNECGETMLHLYTIRGDLDSMKELIQQGADVNVQDFAGWTPLHEACNLGLQEIAQYLLQMGADVNSKGLDDETPLHDAAMNSHQDLVELLLKNGADPQLKNKRGDRPMDIAEDQVIRDIMQNWVAPSDIESGSEHDYPSPSRSEDQLTLRKKPGDGQMSSGSTGSSSGFQELMERDDKVDQTSKILPPIFDLSSDSDTCGDSIVLKNSGLLRLNSSSSASGKASSGPGSPVLVSNFKKRRKHALQEVQPYQGDLTLLNDSSSDSDIRTDRKYKNETLSRNDEYGRHSLVKNGKNNSPKQNLLYATNGDKSRFCDNGTQRAPSIMKKKVTCHPEDVKHSRPSDHNTASPRLKSKTKSCRSLDAELKQYSENVVLKINGFQSTTDVSARANDCADGSVYDFSPSTEDLTNSGAINLKLSHNGNSSDLFDILCLGKKGGNLNLQIKQKLGQDENDLVASKFTLHEPVNKSSCPLPTQNENFCKILEKPVQTTKTVTHSHSQASEKVQDDEPIAKVPANIILESTSLNGNAKTEDSILGKEVKRSLSLPVLQKRPPHTNGTSAIIKAESLVKNKLTAAESQTDGRQEMSKKPSAERKLQTSYVKPSSNSDVKRKKKHKHKHIRDTSYGETKHKERAVSSDRSQSEKLNSLTKEKSSKLLLKRTDSAKSMHSASSRKGSLEERTAEDGVIPAARKKINSTDSTSSEASSKGNKVNSVMKTLKSSLFGIAREKQSTPVASAKKGKLEVKKIALVSDANCAFLSELEKSSKQRLELEKRMKLQRKKKLKQQQQKLKAKSLAEAALKGAKLAIDKSQSMLSNKPSGESGGFVHASKQQIRPQTMSLDAASTGYQCHQNFADRFCADINSLDRSDFFLGRPKVPLQLPVRSALQVDQRLASSQLPEYGKHADRPVCTAPSGKNHLFIHRSQSCSEQLLDGKTPPGIHQIDRKENTPLHYQNGMGRRSSVGDALLNNAGPPTDVPLPVSVNGLMLPPNANHPSIHLHGLVSETLSHKVSPCAVQSSLAGLPANCRGSVTASVPGNVPISSPGLAKAPVCTVTVASNDDNVAKAETDKGSKKVEEHLGPLEGDEKRINENTSNDAESNQENKAPAKAVGEQERSACFVKTEEIKLKLALEKYIEERLSKLKVILKEPWPKRLPVFLPMEKLQKAAEKDLARDRLNVYEERSAIRRQTNELRKRRYTAVVIPQAPECYCRYSTYTGTYLLRGTRESWLSIPVLAPPTSVGDEMRDLFVEHEKERVKTWLRHASQREKLILACEQEILRVHTRAARTLQNQQVPLSACSVLLDGEIYNLERYGKKVHDESGGRASIRDRFNGRMLLSWLQDVSDKYVKMKRLLLARQRHESQALHAVQRTEWFLKLQEVENQGQQQKRGANSKLEDVSEFYVPLVNVSDDFDLLPV